MRIADATINTYIVFMKKCLSCKEIKPLSDFHKNGNGHRPRCKSCLSVKKDYGKCTCKICGSEFQKLTTLNKYCSRKCKYEAELQRRSKKPKTKKCKFCSTEFKPYTSLDKFCSALCRVENEKSGRSRRWNEKSTLLRYGKNNPAYKHGLSPKIGKRDSVGRREYLKRRNQFWKDFEEKNGSLYCEECGKTGRLETHHVIYRSEKPRHIHLHDPKNFMLLCVKCHNDYHSDKSKRNKIVEERKLNDLFGDDVLNK